MAGSTRYWGTILGAALLTAGLCVAMLIAGFAPVWIPIAGLIVACVMFVWSLISLIRKSPPR